MGIVLDTSILIAAEKTKLDLASFAAANKEVAIYIAAITAAEYLVGVERAHPASRRAKRAAVGEQFLASVSVIDYDLTVARQHAKLWAAMAESGNMLGPYDMIIAASALEFGHLLATLNVGEFSKVRGLKLVEMDAFLTDSS